MKGGGGGGGINGRECQEALVWHHAPLIVSLMSSIVKIGQLRRGLQWCGRRLGGDWFLWRGQDDDPMAFRGLQLAVKLFEQHLLLKG